jgi:cytidylate kinase
MSASKRRLVIAIDGPVGAGKSTAARRLAAALGYVYIDSGAMYRAFGWKAVRDGLDLRDRERLAALAQRTDIRIRPGAAGPRVLLDGADVTDALRTPCMDEASSLVSVWPEVRERLVALQRAMAAAGGVVMDGRDIGTVVLPDADLKFYLDADPDIRAARRLRDLERTGLPAEFGAVRSEVLRRDARDSGRAASPLRPAADAIHVDSSRLDADAVLALMLREAAKRSRSDNS